MPSITCMHQHTQTTVRSDFADGWTKTLGGCTREQTGLVFPDPSHMQYGVYSTFRSWWVGRKEELERSIQRWNIVIAKV